MNRHDSQLKRDFLNLKQGEEWEAAAAKISEQMEGWKEKWVPFWALIVCSSICLSLSMSSSFSRSILSFSFSAYSRFFFSFSSWALRSFAMTGFRILEYLWGDNLYFSKHNTCILTWIQLSWGCSTFNWFKLPLLPQIMYVKEATLPSSGKSLTATVSTYFYVLSNVSKVGGNCLTNYLHWLKGLFWLIGILQVLF